MPFRVKSGGGDAGEITGGLTFDGLIDDGIIVDIAAIATEIVVSSGNQYYLRLDNTDTTKPVNALVDWGDGTTTEARGGEIYHEYDMTGERTIKVYPYSADKLMITDVNYRATSVNVNSGIKYVQMQDFQSALTKATFADGVEAIHGFNSCANLADVTIPDSVNQIDAFKNTPYWGACTSNGLVVMGRIAVAIDSDSRKIAIAIPNGVWHVGDYFNGDYTIGQGGHVITSLTLPNGLKTIGYSAFVGNLGDEDSFTSVTFPATVTSIGGGAFAYNTELATVTFANGSVLESIGDSAFYRCGLTSITIPASVTSIGATAFERCNNLATVTLNSDIAIGTNAFADCPITTLTLGGSITTIPENAFSGLTTLTTLTFSSNLLTIGSGAFNGCQITSVTFPATVTSIGANAFKGNKLTSITIPASVTSIGADAFANNSTLSEIHFAGSTPPTITAAIAPNTVYILVPVGAVSAYEAAGYANVHEEGWTPPQYISLTWVTGGINATTGVDKTDDNSERSNSTAAVASEVYSVEWRNPDWRLSYTQFMICCYNKSDGTYAGTYNGTTVTKSETHIHEFNSSDPIDYDLTSLNSQYDFRFVVTGQWGSQSGQGQDIKVYGLPI